MRIALSGRGQDAGVGSTGAWAVRAEKGLLAISLALITLYLVALISTFAKHGWVLDAGGRPIPTDFVGIWSAGRLALRGAALSAYDVSLQRGAEVATVGHDFPGLLGWSYPPSFMLIAAPLARIPYALAFLAFAGVSTAMHGLSIAVISRRLAGLLVALAGPWTLACVIVGQNGMLTATLIGAVLLMMDDRPIAAGLLLGLLTYKPQFGLLFPLALAASGRWRVFGWAAVSALVLAGLSCAVFGVDVFIAFLHSLPRTTQSVIVDGSAGWSKLQSVYGLARSLGTSNAGAWAAQGVLSVAGAIAVAWLWRGRAPFALKAAALAVATVLATPYLFIYDLPLLAVSAAFLYRQNGFDWLDYAALALAVFALALFPLATISTGPFASLAIAAMAARRIIAIHAKTPKTARQSYRRFGDVPTI